MSIAGKLARGRQLQASPSVDQDPYAQWFRSVLLGERSAVGKTVTPETMLQVDAIVSCVQLLSGTVAGMPLRVYSGDIDGEAKPMPGHPTARLLRRRPNPEMSPAAMWSLGMAHLLTQGDTFLGKTFNGSRVTELWPIRPYRVLVQRIKGVKQFVLDNDFANPLGASTIIHVPGLSLDGIRGLSPLGLMREAAGAGLAIDEYTNTTFKNSAIPLGVLETDQELTDSSYKRLKRDWKKKHGGPGRAGEIAILEAGLKFNALSIPLKDLEFVALTNSNALKIARYYRVPASMIDVEVGNKGLHYTSASSDDMHYLKHSVQRWLDLIAGAVMLDTDLFPPSQPEIFCRHDRSRLLEADPVSRANIRAIETGHKAWRLPSEIRAEDNLPPAPELDDAAAQPPPAPVTPGEPPDPAAPAAD